MVKGATAVANEQKAEIVVENDSESEIADSVVVLVFELASVATLRVAIVIVRFVVIVVVVVVVEAETVAAVVADTEISQIHPFLHRGYNPTNILVDASSKPEPKLTWWAGAFPVVASVESTGHELNDNTDDEVEKFASVGSLKEVGADHSPAGDEPAKDGRPRRWSERAYFQN
jgi:hypothetical protein